MIHDSPPFDQRLAPRGGRPVRTRGVLALLAVLTALTALSACAGPETEERYRWAMRYYEAEGLMRSDTAPQDAPFGNAELVRNFERIAFNKEFADGTELRAEVTPVTLLKWRGPVRWRLIGDGVTAEDVAVYRAFTDRISGLTGLRFDMVDEEADIDIMIASREGRLAFLRALQERDALSRMPLIAEWTRNDDYPCVGQVGRSRTAAGWRNRAFIVIKDETRGLLRRSCVHEELVQTLGLLNDDDDVRPSIFNDDQEFALLTRHDEYLLRILYDPRLKEGMTREQGMPLVRLIVDEIGPGPLPSSIGMGGPVRKRVPAPAGPAGRAAGG